MDTNCKIDSYVNSGVQAYAAASAASVSDQQEEEKASAPQKRDQVEISSEGLRAAFLDKDTVLKMETAIRNSDLDALIKAAKEQCKLEVNWDKVVDPDGKIYSFTFVESILRQYQCAENTIKAYYAQAHQENLSFENPYDHILMKYKFPNSPYFRHDMSKEEREMAFRQERDILWKGQVTIGDPYALAASGVMLKVEDVDRIAHQAARDKIDEMIKEYQAKNKK